ncbi:MAG: alpha/beta hydrolase [Chloroflexi bacterium]|nr:alpha/beta hydrolase [Chloroflexota bacterium]
MPPADYSVLDTPDISMNSFYPRQAWTSTPTGAEDHSVAVQEGVALSCRFFPVELEDPTILFFYGNGETAVDYDGIAPLYNQVGVNFFVADYRGYGNSGGSPAFSTMLSDAHKVLEALRMTLKKGGYSGPVFVMGRSMGRHAAFELAANSADGVKGLIIESGRASLGQFANGIDPSLAETLKAEYLDKVRSITMPVLVIHGEVDTLAPVEGAVEMYDDFVSDQKRLVIIPGAGHNDLLHRGIEQYFVAIRDFVSP